MYGAAQGIYGFRPLAGPDRAELPHLSPQDADAIDVSVEWRRASSLIGREVVDEDRVLLARPRAAWLEVRRDPASIVLQFVHPITAEALVHPQLTLPISILARWRGDLTLHAGGFFSAGRAWGVIGPRGAGKSTTLALIAERGAPLLADDLLVLDEGVARPGPACLDLRPDVAERIEGARPIGKVGGRARFRLATSPGPSRAPLGGLFLLEWGEPREPVTLEAVPTDEALRTIYRQEYIGLLGPADPEKIADLLGTPIWRVRRPIDWAACEGAAERMLERTLN